MNSRGAEAERRAAQWLQARGLEVLERNYRCRMGEIDLVAREGATLVFVEVRARSSEAFGGAAASIGAAKRRRLLAAARHYLAARGGREPPCRFDALLITGTETPRVEWLRGAFGAD